MVAVMSELGANLATKEGASIAAVTRAVDSPKGSIASKHRFGLSEIARISGVDVPTIERWMHRKALRVRRIGPGRDRAYTLWQALHVAIIAEMSRMGLPITGRGEDLSNALLGYVRHRVVRDGDAREVGPVSLTIVPETDDWGILPAEWVPTGESCITIGLGPITARAIARSNEAVVPNVKSRSMRPIKRVVRSIPKPSASPNP